MYFYFVNILWPVVIVLGFAARFYFALNYQSRVWIDEMWVVLEPAYRLFKGAGFLNPLDWDVLIRSWLPPSIVLVLLKFFSLLGVEKGTVVLPALRVIFESLIIFAGLKFAKELAGRLQLKQPPVLAAAFFLLTPEFIRYSTSYDLSVMGLPFLLLGLSLFCFKDRLVLGTGLMMLGCLIRYQYFLVPFGLFLGALGAKKNRQALALIAGVLSALAIDCGFNSLIYGRLAFPIVSYFWVNQIKGVAASFGVTPFYFAFEILWRFMTEPAFVVSVLWAPFLVRRTPALGIAILIVTLGHVMIGHKEFRFFYGPAVLLSIAGAVAVQKWAENRKLDKYALPVILSAFIVVAGWRGANKVAWAEFEVPSSLETKAGVMPDIRGLIVYGWSGIRSGGAFTFHRDLPYEFAETLESLRLRKLDAARFNYVITGTAHPAPCLQVLETREGASLYKCTEGEISALVNPP